MVARLFSLGLALGLSSLALLGLSHFSSAHAAHPVWSAYAAQAKRPQFRPWSRAPRKSAGLRWRPQPEAVTRSRGSLIDSRMTGRPIAQRAEQPEFFADRARNIEPLAVRSGLGARFRPDQRRSGYGQRLAIGEQDRLDKYQARLHSQFRPPEARRKQTYEQLQYGIISVRRMGMPHWAVAASDMRGYGGQWSGW